MLLCTEIIFTGTRPINITKEVGTSQPRHIICQRFFNHMAFAFCAFLQPAHYCAGFFGAAGTLPDVGLMLILPAGMVAVGAPDPPGALGIMVTFGLP